MEARMRSGFWAVILIAVCCIILSGYGGTSVSAETQRPKNVQVALRAKWSGTSLLLEPGWKGLYWEFVEALLSNESGNTDLYTARDCFQKFTDYGKSLVTGPLTSVFELSLTLRSSSPRLVLYLQLAEESLSSHPLSDDINSNFIDGGVSEVNDVKEGKKADSLLVGVNPRSPGGKCCWVDTGGALFFYVPELSSWLRNPHMDGDIFQQPELFDFDHLYIDSSIGSPIAILYGALGTDCFKNSHCSEKDHEPPRGLQMILGTKNNPHLVDMLVMANLGYWQMKVSPGVWYLQLAPGRSSDLYTLQDGSEMSPTKRITIDYLRGKPVHLGVVKKKGKEHEQLLIPSDDDSPRKQGEQDTWNSNILKWASSLIGGNVQSKNSDNINNGRKGKTINIFSIASGHLYERFLKIMILSVLKNTERPVKFWFIKNYLSPQFKDAIPHMAREYGFEYELVTYKWPSWLHKQKEKQRIIWAYKILFLDVIFPLSLEKVIFVDADQIVRADMGELYDMNLKGRPLAYTPFCDNNRDMDGFRFWKQGFWKEHLRGRPYHISALYVVDLIKFRETAAGDNLRVFYETLSKDPNSLSNLDQDLPNYAQHTVPIFSLPQEWLWCESWCGNATKSRAKTIDLCNNPMTKEPKLQGARRIVTEWPDLDQEARHFTSKILGEEVSPVEKAVSPVAQPQVPEEDLETRAEL